MTKERSFNRWEETRLAIVKTSKVRNCPLCGEKLSLFDITHMKERHTEYYRETKKWRLANALSLVLEPVFFIVGDLSQDWFVRWLAVWGALIAMSFVFVTFFKWLTIAERYQVSWWKLTFF